MKKLLTLSIITLSLASVVSASLEAAKGERLVFKQISQKNGSKIPLTFQEMHDGMGFFYHFHYNDATTKSAGHKVQLSLDSAKRAQKQKNTRLMCGYVNQAEGYLENIIKNLTSKQKGYLMYKKIAQFYLKQLDLYSC
jgi:hypothetical protein